MNDDPSLSQAGYEKLAVLEATVSRDPGDDLSRRLYIEAAESLGEQARAAEVLGRALKKSKDGEVRERVGFDVGSLYLREGELRAARNAFLDVVLVDAGAPSAAAAARKLLDLEVDPADPQVVAAALEVIAKVSTEPAERADAGARLLAGHESKPLKESRLVVAYQALADSPDRGDDALRWLRAHLEKKGDRAGLAQVLRRQALRASDPSEARDLALRSLSVAASEGDGDAERAARWLWFVDHLGGDRAVHAELVPALVRLGRWKDLDRVLAREAELAGDDEAPLLLARLGALRLEHLADTRGALDAAARCLSFDPKNDLARQTLEQLLEKSDRRLAAADVLETICEGKDPAGMLRVHEARAELLEHASSRLAAFSSAVELAAGPLGDPARAVSLAGRALAQALAFAPDSVGAWLERLARVTRDAGLARAEADVLLAIIEGAPLDSANRIAIAAAAAGALQRAGDEGRALALCERALAADPTAPDVLTRLDALRAGAEPAAERLARYERAVEGADAPDRRRVLLHALAAIQRDAGRDLPAAIATWERILAGAPADRVAHEALIDAAGRVGDPASVLAAIERARGALDGRARQAMTVRKAELLAAAGRGAEGLSLCASLLEEDPGARALWRIADLAREKGDRALERRALERLAETADAGDPDAEPRQASASHDPDGGRRRALERLGEARLAEGDTAGAADAWRAAARASAEAGDAAGERALCERALEARGDDRAAARRLVEIHGRSGDWARLGAAFRALVRAKDDGAAGLLLELAPRATAPDAARAFVTLADLLLEGADPSGDGVVALERARARALAADPDRESDASTAFRALIARLGSDDDVRAFEAFYEGRADGEHRHRDRRWLLAWRADRAPDPTAVLETWAEAEEAHGDPEAALALYRRLASGDGGKVVLAPERRRALDLRVARLLLDALRRPAEAAATLATWLGVHPPDAEVHAIARRLLLDAATGPVSAARFEQAAEAREPAGAFQAFDALSSAAEGAAALGAERRRWFERLIALAAQDPPAALGAALRGVAQFPDAASLWSGAERLARELRRPEALAHAYEDVLLSGNPGNPLPPDAVEALGRRMLALETEFALTSARSIAALESVLSVAPGARWALDRVKVALGSQGRWEELFAVYDRAVAVAPGERERAEWLREAAFAARDLAGQPERAMRYLDALHELAPGDATVEAALERLCDRLGRKRDLVAFLERRAARAPGFQRRDLRRRMASLWLDLGEADRAHGVLVQMLEADPLTADVVDLLERVLASGTASPDVEAQAVLRLRSHYEALGSDRVAEVIRLARRSLSLASDPAARSSGVRDLVALRFQASLTAEGAPEGATSSPDVLSRDVFSRVLAEVDEDAAGDPALERVAYRAVLMRALRAMRVRRDGIPAAPGSAQAAEGAWRALHRLTATLSRAGEARAAFQLLHRGGRLPFESARRRELLAAAAAMSADVLGDVPRAIAIFERLFADEPGDAIAAASLPRFAALLDASGAREKLAALWEQQARVQAAAGNGAEACANWDRAGALWERQGDVERALAAYGQGGALGSPVSLAAAARLRVARAEWTDAAKALASLLPRTTGRERTGVAVRLADAFVELGRRDLARARLEECAAGAHAEDMGPVRSRLMAIYRLDEAWDPLARLAALEADRAPERDEKLALLREAAVLQSSRLARPEAAAELLERAVALAPDDPNLRASLLDALERSGSWERVAALLREEIAALGDRRAAEHARTHLRLARALARARAPGEALAELRVAEGLRPGQPVVLWELARASLDAGELDDAERAFRALLLSSFSAGPAPDAEERVPASRAAVILDLAEIAARRGDAARAADLVDSAFDEAAERGEDPAPLEATLRARGRDDGLARALGRRVEGGATLTERAVALSEFARLWARTGRAAEAGERIRRHTERLAHDLEREERADVAAWIALAGAAAARRAEGDPVGPDDPEARAVAAIGRAAAADPGAREPAEWLGERLERDGRIEELAALRARRVSALAVATSPAESARASFELGHALELAGRPEDATAAYEAAASAGPKERDLLRTLADRLERLGSGRLADVLELLLAVDPSAGIGAAMRLVDLRGRQSDAEGTARALVLAFALEPGRAEIRDRLVAAHERRGEWSEAATLLRRAVAAAPEDRALFKRLIEAHRKVPDETEALRALDARIAAHPADAELLALRAPVRERLGDGDGAAADLEAAAMADARYLGPFGELLSRLADRADPSLADRHTLRLVDLLVRMNRPKQARRELDRVLSRRPEHVDGLERLAALLAAEGSWEAAADTYRRLLAAVERGTDPTLLGRVAAATAEACARAGQLEAARAGIDRALGTLSARPEARAYVERICRATRDWTRLAESLVSRAGTAGGDTQGAESLVEAARLLLDEGSAPEAAAAIVETARAAKPDDLDVLLLWARVQVAVGRANHALLALYEAAEKHGHERTPALAAVYLAIGKAHLAVDEVVEAFDALDAAFAIDWRTGDVAMLLGLVALDLDDEKTAERALSSATSLPPRRTGAGPGSTPPSAAGTDAATKAIAYYHLASIALGKGDLAKARRLAGKAVGGDPAHVEARALLEKLEPFPAALPDEPPAR